MAKDTLTEEMRTLYTRVAFYYYKRGLTQEEIAGRMHMSRQRVNRILSECSALGIVEIRIRGNDSSQLKLEAALEDKYSLKAARVVGAVTKDTAYAELGLCAGRYLSEVIKDNDVIGFSRGNTLSALVDQMAPLSQKNLVITQLMGGWNNRYNNLNGDDIVHRFSQRAGGVRTNMLFAPVLVKDASVRQAMVQEPYYQEAYKVIQSCTIAVLGIGDVEGQRLLPSLEQASYHDSLPAAAIGEVCAHFFDKEGRRVSCDFDDKVLSVELDDLFRIPLRIGVAGLPSKVNAITGAIRGGYVNALVTDIDTAAALCR